MKIVISFDVGIKNLAYCIIKIEDEKIEIINWDIITLINNKKINDTTEQLYNELDNLIGILEDFKIKKIDYVLIENQPSRINGIMKTIQILIYSYFNLLKHWDNKVNNILLINARLKLENYKDIINLNNNKKSKKDLYKENKINSIIICKKYIENNDKLLNIIDSYKKQDDLADCFLQGIEWIKKTLKIDINIV